MFAYRYLCDVIFHALNKNVSDDVLSDVVSFSC